LFNVAASAKVLKTNPSEQITANVRIVFGFPEMCSDSRGPRATLSRCLQQYAAISRVPNLFGSVLDHRMI
jgi:hypothetical protein